MSPIMHNSAFERLNLDFVYVAFRVRTGELKHAMVGARSLHVLGLNVTMPHKSAVMKYLDQVDSMAKSIGAVNTILNDDGKLLGCNTDGVGMLRALKENGITLNGKKILLLGAGGAAKAIAFHAGEEADELVVINKTLQKAEDLAEALRKESGKRIGAKPLSSRIIEEELKDVDMLINATSVGMHPHVDQSIIPSSLLRPDLCVMDIVYDPLETKLVKDAKAAGAKAISGIEMLIYQGAASFEVWTHQPAPVDVMRRAVLSKMSESGVYH